MALMLAGIGMLSAILCISGRLVDRRSTNNSKDVFEGTTLTVCTIIESGKAGFFIDYNRIAAVLDIAVQHANNLVLPDNFRIVRKHKNAGLVCAPKTPALSRFLEWMVEGVTCDIFIGPGMLGLYSMKLSSMVT